MLNKSLVENKREKRTLVKEKARTGEVSKFY
jgi:hypothetical protein